jgi:hypothetical protein
VKSEVYNGLMSPGDRNPGAKDKRTTLPNAVLFASQEKEAKAPFQVAATALSFLIGTSDGD